MKIKARVKYNYKNAIKMIGNELIKISLNTKDVDTHKMLMIVIEEIEELLAYGKNT